MELSSDFRCRLLGLDLDGTTLNEKHRISERTIAILQKLSHLGVIVCICTGRASDSVFSYAKTLNLPQEFTPMIVFNGSVCLIYDNKTAMVRELFAKPIEPHASRLLVELAERQGLVIQLYNGSTGDVYAKPTTPLHIELLERYEALVERRQQRVQSYEDVYAICPNFAKMLVLTYEPDEFMQACRESLPEGMFHMIRGSPDPFFVEFLLPASNKGTALVSLCEHLNVSVSETIAFGDGENDVEMLQAAAIGCAMSNARPMCKTAANLTTDFANHEDGVAIQLEKFLEMGFFNA